MVDRLAVLVRVIDFGAKESGYFWVSFVKVVANDFLLPSSRLLPRLKAVDDSELVRAIVSEEEDQRLGLWLSREVRREYSVKLPEDALAGRLSG